MSECTQVHRKYGMSYQLNDETLEDHLAYGFKQEHGLIYSRGGQGASDMTVQLANHGDLRLQIKGIRIQQKKKTHASAVRLSGPRLARIAKETSEKFTTNSPELQRNMIAEHIGEGLRVEHEKTDMYVIVLRMDTPQGMNVKVYSADRTSPIYFENNYELVPICKKKTWNYFPQNKFKDVGKTTTAIVQPLLAWQWWIYASIADFETHWPGVVKHLDITI